MLNIAAFLRLAGVILIAVGSLGIALWKIKETKVEIREIPVSISTLTLQDGRVGSFYSQNIQASGGTTPYTWSKARGTLPPSLTLDM